LKIVGEAFPFRAGATLALGVDSHNSVHGLRVYAARGRADVKYFGCGENGGIDMNELQEILHSSDHGSDAPSLLVLTGQSNVTNAKIPLVSLLPVAREAGFYTLLDAAALAPTSRISLRTSSSKHPPSSTHSGVSPTAVDALAISFYKMFGFPTGIGALVARRTFLGFLQKPWFAGGTVDFVQVPGQSFTLSAVEVERFEDGTLNYLSLPGIARGLAFLDPYMPVLPLRLSILSHYLASELAGTKHKSTGAPLVHIISRMPKPLQKPGDQAKSHGFIVSVVFLDRDGQPLLNEFVEFAAQIGFDPVSGKLVRPPVAVTKSPVPQTKPNRKTKSLSLSNIAVPIGGFGNSVPEATPFGTRPDRPVSYTVAVRSGCMCNPGGVVQLLHRSGLFPPVEASGETASKPSSTPQAGLELDLETWMAQLNMPSRAAAAARFGGDANFGVVRMSLGLASNFGDVWRVIRWARCLLADEEVFGELWKLWLIKKGRRGAQQDLEQILCSPGAS